MNISAPFIQRPVATILLAIALAVAGVVCYIGLAVSPLPQMYIPIIIVKGSLPGASPETMASSVATPLLRSLGSISGVDEIGATSTEGNTEVFLSFQRGKDENTAAREVQAAINATRPLLPSSMRNPPTYHRVNPSSTPIITLVLTSDRYSQGDLYDFGSTILAQKLSQVQGVGSVKVGGSSLPAVRVDINPMQLSAYGISSDSVRQMIQDSNQLKPRGFIENSSSRWQINTNGTLYKAADYRGLVLRWQKDSVVRLGDVAKVYDSIESDFNTGFYNNKQAVVVVVRAKEDANIIKTVEAVRAQLPAMQTLLPAQVDLQVSQDRTPSIRATLHEAQLNLLIAVVLVILVVLIFLRNWRATLIPAISIPLSLLGTFTVMYFMNFSLNTISLMALIVATGFVVDDSIVVVENITRYLEKGYKPLKAALLGTKEVSFTVVSINLSLVVVFLPLLLVGDLIGLLFYEFAVTISAAILVSLVVALTVTPMLCALWLRLQDLKENQQNQKRPLSTRFFDALLLAYKKSLLFVLRWRLLALISLIAAIALNIYLFIIIPKGLFPKQDTGVMISELSVDQGASFKTMIEKLDIYRKILLEDPNVETVLGYAGGEDGATSTFMLIQLKPFDERSLTVSQVIDNLRPKLSKIAGSQMFLVARQDIRVGRQDSGDVYEYSIKAGDLETLREWTEKIAVALKNVPQLVDVQDKSNDRSRRLELDIDREAAMRLGVDMSLVTNTLNDLFGQRQVSVMYEALNQYHVVLGASASFTKDSSVLNELTLVTKDGKAVPLSAFTRLKFGNTPNRVNHKDGMLADSVRFSLAPGVSLSQAKEAIEGEMQRINLPTRTVQAGLSGNAEAFEKMNRQQPLMLLGVLALLYILLGILYESYIHPLTILSTLPSAGLGGLLALMMAKMEFTIIALIGVFLLIGLVKKNAIIMIDFALNKKRNEQMSTEDAVYEACIVRFRPILMTTMAAIFGALPLIIATGAGVEMRQPLGVTIVGGLIVSQLLTLYTTPVVYIYLDNLATKFKARYRHPKEINSNEI